MKAPYRTLKRIAAAVEGSYVYRSEAVGRPIFGKLAEAGCAVTVEEGDRSMSQDELAKGQSLLKGREPILILVCEKGAKCCTKEIYIYSSCQSQL